eukprot:scaffold3456_cov58-Phaeocystis_antarctica.AAC.5
MPQRLEPQTSRLRARPQPTAHTPQRSSASRKVCCSHACASAWTPNPNPNPNRHFYLKEELQQTER